jgi:hypothetical protein
MVWNWHPADHTLVGQHFVGVHQMIELRQGVAGGGAGDLHFFGFGRIVELDEEHEPIELGLGERIRAFLLHGILRGQHQKGLFQLEGFAYGRDFVFLHGFQHGGLRFWGSTIDFVGQHNVGEHRTMDEMKFTATVGAILKNIGAGDVHRHQIRSELNTAEAERHGLGHLADEQGFRQAWHAHQQGMAAGKQANAQPLNDPILPDDDPGQFFA